MKNEAPKQGTKQDLISSLAEVKSRLAIAEHHLQVEDSLARIRARTMTMRTSEDMSEVIALVFQELQSLGFDNQTCALSIIDEETHDSRVWRVSESSNSAGQSYYVPAFDHPVYKNIIRGWQDQSSFIVADLKDEILTSYYSHLFEHSEYSKIPEARRQEILKTPHIVWTMVFMKHGTLAVVDYGLTARSLDESRIAILRKVAQTVDLTYERFLELQKAEERAREAEHKASATRIRAEVISMDSIHDLERISTILWTELNSSRVSFIRCGIVLIHEKDSTMEVYLTRNDGSTFNPFRIPYNELPTFPRAVEAWRRQESYNEVWDSKGYYAWAKLLIKYGVMLPEDIEYFEEAEIGGVNLNFVPFVHGHLYVGSPKPLDESQINHLMLLAEAFSVAYVRYNDFKLLETKNHELAKALNHLETTQSQLVQSEKLASLGKLTAGIAHEIKNPLNFVNNFAEISIELAEELESCVKKGEDVSFIVEDIKQNAQHIAKHGRRAASIVNSMMQHASGSQGTRQEIELNTFIAEYMNLAYHGMRARTSDFNTTLNQEFDEQAGTVEMVPQEIGRVLINLFNNAFFAMHERAKEEGLEYKPILTVRTKRIHRHVEISVIDNGPGIPQKVKDKIFEPFFTTKSAGSGTGLGLSLSLDIITQGHNGNLTVDSEPGKGTSFKITLPA